MRDAAFKSALMSDSAVAAPVSISLAESRRALAYSAFSYAMRSSSIVYSSPTNPSQVSLLASRSEIAPPIGVRTFVWMLDSAVSI